MNEIHPLIEQLSKILEIAGVAIIILGVAVATFWFVKGGFRGNGWRTCYEQYRADLGRGILLGLELLVGADIIGTITAPLTFTSVGLLAVIVVIRTFLSFALETEIEGCWPWQRRAMQSEYNTSSRHRER